ncbi:MAG: exosortase-associated EpsI family protein [Capsulimonadaceae bacterium]
MSNFSRVATVLALTYGLAASLALLWPREPAPKFHWINADCVPRAISPYGNATDYDVGAVVRNTLSTGEIIARSYGPGSDSVDFVLIGGMDMNSMHDPRFCLAGYSITNDRVVTLPGTHVNARAYRITAPDKTAYNVVYFYSTAGRINNEYARVRENMIWRDLTGQRPQHIYFLRFCQLAPPGLKNEDASFTRLDSFAAAMWMAIGSHLA